MIFAELVCISERVEIHRFSHTFTQGAIYE